MGKRIKDLSRAETDGYLAVDNATNGTGKMHTSLLFGYASRTPFDLGVKNGVAGSLNVETGFITKNILLNRATYAYMLCGKGTTVSVFLGGESLGFDIKGFCIVKYKIDTGEYIDTIGNVLNNLSSITVDEDCFIAIYVNTDAENVTSSLEDVGARFFIRLSPTRLNLVPFKSAFEQGAFSGGIPAANIKRLRTSLFVKCGKGTTISNSKIDQGYQVLKYDIQSQAYKSITGSYRHLPCVQIDEDCYVKLMCMDDADVEMSPSGADYYLIEKEADESFFSVYKTPYQLGVVNGECGYINTSNAQINRTINKNNAIYGFIHFGKGSNICLKGSSSLLGMAIVLYDEKTGVYKTTLGNTNLTSSNNILIPYDCVGVIVVKGTADDVSSSLDDIEKNIWINLCAPSMHFNSYPTPFESGSLDYGNPVANVNRVRSSEFILMGKGSVIFLKNISDYFIVSLYSAKDKGWYSSSGILHLPCFMLSEDAYVKVVEAHDVSATFDLTAVYLNAYITQASSKTLPSYYFEDDYIQDVCAKVNSHDEDCGFSGDGFIFITDVHWSSNLKKSPALIEYLKNHTSIRNVIFGGDAVNVYSTKDEVKSAYDEYREVMDSFKYYGWCPTIGNHEFGLPSTGVSVDDVRLSPSEAYALVTKENESIIKVIDEFSYYYDNEKNKIRYIIVGCNGGATIPQSTSDAVIDILDNLPTGYLVLVVSHVGIVAGSLTIDSTIQDIVDKLDEMQAENSVIGILSGHRHLDGEVVTDAGTNVIATTCDGFAEAAGGLTRTRGTTTEQAFDVVQIDTTNRKLYLTRVGAGQDREFDY